MKELFEKQGHSIFTFEKGDILIKVNSRIITKELHNENLGISIDVKVGDDDSFRRKPLEFIGVENNTIYLRDLKEDSYFRKKYIHTALLEKHSEGWALFVAPDGLTLEDCI